METKKIIGGLLIIISLVIGYMGVNKISANSQEVNLLGLKIDVWEMYKITKVRFLDFFPDDYQFNLSNDLINGKRN